MAASNNSGAPGWPQRLRRLTLCLASCLALSAGLTACGPGVGGTGVGETQVALTSFGALSLPLCSSDLAPLLACPVGASPVELAQGTAPVHFADTIDGRQVRVRVAGNEIELNAPCVLVLYRGLWGAQPGQSARFFGNTAPDTAPAAATLQAQVNGMGLQLTLHNAQGALLLGPLLVMPAPAPTQPAACQ